MNRNGKSGTESIGRLRALLDRVFGIKRDDDTADRVSVLETQNLVMQRDDDRRSAEVARERAKTDAGAKRLRDTARRATEALQRPPSGAQPA